MRLLSLETITISKFKQNSHMKKTVLLTVIVLASLTSLLMGQTTTIDIWHSKVPGAIANPDFKQFVDSANGWIKMRHVTDPSLDVYPAPKEIATGTAVIICPGGGYWGLAIAHEGAAVAQWFNKLGITAFVLKYRMPDDLIMKDKSIAPLQDAQEAIRTVRRQAKTLGISANKIGIMGFSAGGHLASTASTHFAEKVYDTKDTTSARPDFSLLIYPVISMDSTITHMGSRNFLLGQNATNAQVIRFSNERQVSAQTPPAFLVHSLNDDVVPVQNSINYALELKKFGVPCELHIYQSGGHGYGMGRSAETESSWTEACRKWLKISGF
jgi:acetyl esterase/lipase